MLIWFNLGMIFLDTIRVMSPMDLLVHLEIKTVTKCGVAQEEMPNDDPITDGPYTRPWHVALKILASDLSRESNCYGSFVSPNWILTAAHCFARYSVPVLRQMIEVTHG